MERSFTVSDLRSLFDFDEKPYFKAEEKAKEVPKVEF